jgi:hypothetical protein
MQRISAGVALARIEPYLHAQSAMPVDKPR